MVAAKLATLQRGEKKANGQTCLSQDDAAGMANVSTRSVRAACKVRDKGAPGLAEAVERGDLSDHRRPGRRCIMVSISRSRSCAASSIACSNRYHFHRASSATPAKTARATKIAHRARTTLR